MTTVKSVHVSKLSSQTSQQGVLHDNKFKTELTGMINF